MRIMLLDCLFSVENAQNVAFESSESCFDYDLVIWDISQTFMRFSPGQRPYLSIGEASVLVTARNRRKAEFEELAKLGRSLIVFPAMNDAIRIDTGQKSPGNPMAGTRKTIIELRDALPFALGLDPGKGSKLQPHGRHAPSLWREAEGWLVYRGVLRKYPGDPMFYIKGTDKVVGSAQENPGGGWHFVLPEPWCVSVDEDGYRLPVAVTENWIDAPQKLINWVTGVIAPKSEQKPDWADEYSFPEAADRSSRLAELEANLGRILGKIDDVKAEQAEDDLWKVLVYGQGSSLEGQVRRAFELFGFDIMDAVEGRADLRVSYGGKVAVVEVKGLAKSAAEKNASQLEKWVSEEISAGEGQPKPILVANTWRERKPDERGEVDFPDQMLKYVRDRNHCLVSGVQLLAMVRAALRDPAAKSDIASGLMSTVGVIDGWAIDGVLVRD
ncbi:hypothetical protein [Streptomyces sp. NBC_00989]|uniref:hypothetical protein n=1 Tax=Streptomyces sp. NBC_00989 TaxID=2903705 RepID=UPI00386721B4|nr:hypothetical protein OG714_17760 [Streptomyces sp. NBC_00989]